MMMIAHSENERARRASNPCDSGWDAHMREIICDTRGRKASRFQPIATVSWVKMKCSCFSIG